MAPAGERRKNPFSLLDDDEYSSSLSCMRVRLGLSDAKDVNVDVGGPRDRDSSCVGGSRRTVKGTDDCLTDEGVLVMTKFVLGLGGDGHVE